MLVLRVVRDILVEVPTSFNSTTVLGMMELCTMIMPVRVFRDGWEVTCGFWLIFIRLLSGYYEDFVRNLNLSPAGRIIYPMMSVLGCAENKKVSR